MLQIERPKKYSAYIHGHLIPWFEEKRADGKLRYGKLFYLLIIKYVGKAQVTLEGNLCNYEGELDESNQPCGIGESSDVIGTMYSSTWLDGVRNGICK